MAASKTERRVFLWKLRPRPIPSQADVAVTLEEVLALISSELHAGTARVYLTKDSRFLDDDDDVERDPKHQIYIADIKRNARHNTVTILINRGDPDAVSPAFIHSETAGVRVEHPQEKESPGWSAHLAISLGADGQGAYRACFEKMPRVSSSLVMSAIDKIVTKAAVQTGNYNYVHSFRERGRLVRQSKPYRPTFGLNKVPSEKLSNDLDSATLTGITLTKRKLFYAGVGAANLVKNQQEKIIISTHPADKTTVRSFISGVMSKARDEGYEDISFHVEDLPGGVTKSATMSLDEVDAMEVLYVRAQRITGFEYILEACYATVCVQIESKLIEILNATEFGGTH